MERKVGEGVRDRVRHCSMNRPRDEPPCPENATEAGAREAPPPAGLP